MSEKPILFSEDMVKALLDGRKTQTRRVISPQPDEAWMRWAMSEYRGQWTRIGTDTMICVLTEDSKEVRCPYDADRLWVREKHTIECPYGLPKGCDNPDHIIYWASEVQIIRDSITAKWRPSIYMPRWASRITLQVNEIRVERARDISEADCFLEGAIPSHLTPPIEPVSVFRELWDSINAKRGFSWITNPWVWVVEFEVTDDEN